MTAATPEIVTLGCRLNTLESEVMRDELAKVGAPDTIIVNTCAVTAEAERQARQTIRRLRRDTNERGRSVESVLEQYLRVVRPMHLQFCAPSKRHAHIIIPEGGHNQVAIDLIVTKIADIARERDRLRARLVQEGPGAARDSNLSGGGT